MIRFAAFACAAFIAVFSIPIGPARAADDGPDQVLQGTVENFYTEYQFLRATFSRKPWNFGIRRESPQFAHVAGALMRSWLNRSAVQVTIRRSEIVAIEELGNSQSVH
jgi:hypothetical protein